MRARVLLVAGVVVAGSWVVAGTPVAADASTTATAACVASWTQQPVSEVGSSDNVLFTITGTSPSSLYATGRANTAGGYDGRILRDTGSGWHDLTLPALGASPVELGTSVAPAAGVAWVGGAAIPGSGVITPVLLHVVGSAVTRVALPAPPTGYGELLDDQGPALASSGGSDLWVGAGFQATDGSGTTSVLYRPTTSGGFTSTPLPLDDIDTIAAISPTVGYVGGDGLYRVSGGTATPVTLPGDPAHVTDVVADGADDVWALVSSSSSAQSVLHDDRGTWTTLPLPDADTAGALSTIALAPNGILWALGSTTDDIYGGYETTLSRYDPTSATWTATRATPDAPTDSSSAALGLLALASGNLYTAGFGDGQRLPVVAKLCQLPASLTGGASAVAVRALGDGVMVTAPAGAATASVTDSTGLLSTGALHAGQGAALQGYAGGTYALRSTAGGTATFSVPLYSYGAAHSVTVQVATQRAPAGYTYGIQVRAVGTTAWTSTTTTPSTGYLAKILYPGVYPPGPYQVRSRVQRAAAGGQPAVSSGWSPVITVTVPPAAT